MLFGCMSCTMKRKIIGRIKPNKNGNQFCTYYGFYRQYFRGLGVPPPSSFIQGYRRIVTDTSSLRFGSRRIKLRKLRNETENGEGVDFTPHFFTFRTRVEKKRHQPSSYILVIPLFISFQGFNLLKTNLFMFFLLSRTECLCIIIRTSRELSDDRIPTRNPIRDDVLSNNKPGRG